MKDIETMKETLIDVQSALDQLEHWREHHPCIRWSKGDDAFSFLEDVVKTLKRRGVVGSGGFLNESEFNKVSRERGKNPEDVLMVGEILGLWYEQESNGRWYIPRTGGLWKRIFQDVASDNKMDSSEPDWMKYPSVKKVLNPPPGTSLFSRGTLLAKALFGMSRNNRTAEEGLALVKKVIGTMSDENARKKIADNAKRLIKDYWSIA